MAEALRSFLLRGNVTDLAVGVAAAAAFGWAAHPVADDLVTPGIRLLLGPVQMSPMYIHPL